MHVPKADRAVSTRSIQPIAIYNPRDHIRVLLWNSNVAWAAEYGGAQRYGVTSPNVFRGPVFPLPGGVITTWLKSLV